MYSNREMRILKYLAQKEHLNDGYQVFYHLKTACLNSSIDCNTVRTICKTQKSNKRDLIQTSKRVSNGLRHRQGFIH
jgi:hypothetical protein